LSKENRKTSLLKLWRALSEDATTWKSHWKEIADYLRPRKGRYLSGDDEKTNDGTRKDQKIINGAPVDALRILAAGMQGGLTPPSRPWFSLSLADEELVEFAPVRNWLHDVRTLMLDVFSRSNFYGAIHSLYTELGAFGTGAMLIEEDFSSIIRVRPFTIGEYYLALDSSLRVNKLVRQFSMTADQLVASFGLENVSDSVKSVYNSRDREQRFKVLNLIIPNENQDKRDPGMRAMEYETIYFEQGNSGEDSFLRIGGYESKPFVTPRWDVTGADTYGEGRGMDALGDLKMLQKMELKALKALDKMVDPPMNAPPSMRKTGGTIVAGDVNYVDAQQGPQAFAPTYQIRPDIQNIEYKIARVESRIKEYFFNNLFLSVLSADKRMTATEIAERHEEKMSVLGPAIERLQTEVLGIVIDRTFNILDRFGLIPPRPEEIEGLQIKVEYISLLAQAQKLVEVRNVEQTAAFVGNLAAINPEVIDKMDFDEAVDQYASMVGVSPKIIRSDDQVKEIREQRALIQQNAQIQQTAQSMAEGAKTLSEADTSGDNALTGVLEGLT
jgi:hypothetical protein